MDFYTAKSYATFKSWLYLQVELDSKAKNNQWDMHLHYIYSTWVIYVGKVSNK